MLRTLLTATALTGSMTLAAIAQDAQTEDQGQAEPETQVETEGDVQIETEGDVQVEGEDGAQQQTEGQDQQQTEAQDQQQTEGQDQQQQTEGDAQMQAEGQDQQQQQAEGQDQQQSAVTLESGYVQSEGDFLGSELMGSTVYNSTAEDAEALGDINDVVLNDEGDIVAIVIGVGGFLGIGEKAVAVGFDQVERSTDPNGEPRFVLQTTVEALEAAPAFEWQDPQAQGQQQAPAGDGGAMAPADDGGAMAPADEAPADQQAPADQAPAEEAPAEEAPAEETPAQ